MRVELTKVEQQDLVTLLSWTKTFREMVQWSGPWNFTFPLDEEQLASFFLAESLGEDAQRVQFKAIDTDTGHMIGQTGFSRIRNRTRYGCLGPVIVDPARREQGIGTQIVRETVRYGFEVQGLHRIELVVFDFNQRAISCYERLGFQREGLHRDVVNVDGTWWNWATMSILEEEWNPSDED